MLGELDVLHQEMKAFLIIVCFLLILLGLYLLIHPVCFLLDLSIGDFEPMYLRSIIPNLLFAYLAFKYPVAYLRKRNENTANPIVIIVGIVVWMLLIKPTNYIIHFAYSFFIIDGNLPWPEALIILPVFVGMFVIRLLQSGIKRSFSKQNSEQTIGHSPLLTESKSK